MKRFLLILAMMLSVNIAVADGGDGGGHTTSLNNSQYAANEGGDGGGHTTSLNNSQFAGGDEGSAHYVNDNGELTYCLVRPIVSQDELNRLSEGIHRRQQATGQNVRYTGPCAPVKTDGQDI